MVKKKETSIETLRGLAIILMVTGHVIGHAPDAGMQVDDDSFYRYFYYTLMFLRMPLFTVISGYVYALRPVVCTKELTFLSGKARRVLLPMIFVATLYYLLQHFVPGTNAETKLSEIWKIYFFSFSHFWFLQALFLVFIAITVIERFKLLHSFLNWLLLLVLSGLFFLFVPIRLRSLVFQISGTCFHFLFWESGCTGSLAGLRQSSCPLPF